ncbi:MAG: hypothetical protein AABX01_07810 [Candidatus Micrarchaeota archaeon]
MAKTSNFPQQKNEKMQRMEKIKKEGICPLWIKKTPRLRRHQKDHFFLCLVFFAIRFTPFHLKFAVYLFFG